MQYKVSFLDDNGNEFLGTTRHFTTDGRYSLKTIHAIALDTKNKLYSGGIVTGYVVRKNSFNNNVITTVKF